MPIWEGDGPGPLLAGAPEGAIRRRARCGCGEGIGEAGDAFDGAGSVGRVPLEVELGFRRIPIPLEVPLAICREVIGNLHDQVL